MPLLPLKKIYDASARPLLTAREKMLMAGGIAVLFAALFYDDVILRFLSGIRFDTLDGFMLFTTDFGLLYGILMLLAFLLVYHRYRDLTLMILTGGLALEISYLLKVFFQTPRPFAAAIVATIPLTQAAGFSMPSLHTAFCFSVWPYVPRIFVNKKLRILAYTILILIAFSRLYLGVHYASDVTAGALIGYLTAKIWIYLEDHYRILKWFIYHIKDKFELRRQVVHLVIGCTIVFLLRLQLLNAAILFWILVVGGILSLASRRVRLPFLYRVLLYFERPGDLEYFPGKGSFFLVLGSLLAMLLFKREIALAAISIMAVGDSVTTIIGTYFGKIKNPLNPKKHVEGSVLAIIAGTLAAFFFVDFRTALAGSIVGMIFESMAGHYISAILDDNLIIPLVAGAVMTMMG